MTQPDIELSTGEVRRHAGDVDQVAEMLSEALAGAVHVHTSGHAYGQLVGPMFTRILNPVQEHEIQVIRDAVDATQAIADLLDTVAANLDLTDTEAARRFGGTDG